MPAKPPYRPQTSVELLAIEDRPAIIVGFREPVRRVRREGYDCRFAMKIDEAYNLYTRLGRALRRQAREQAQARRSGQRG